MRWLELVLAVITALGVLAWRIEVIVSLLKQHRNETSAGQAKHHDNDSADGASRAPG